jgi:beta-glucosidase
MSAYMDLNGVPAAANRWLLTEVLRGQFGFGGFVVSDANAVRSLETQHFARDAIDAAVRAVASGLDMEMSMGPAAFARLPHAVAEGRLTQEVLDAAVVRVLTAKFRLGLFENPFTDEVTAPAVLSAPAHRDTARKAAEQSIVLLKNAGNTLPLAADAHRSIAVIGQLAESKRDHLGPWVFDYDIDETVTILDSLRSRLAHRVDVQFAAGAGIPERKFRSMFDRRDSTVPTTPMDYDDDREIDRAVELAAAADVALVVVGQRQNQAGEKASTATLDLPGRQLEQLQRIVATGTSVVLIVMSGRPLDLRWADAHVPAIVQAWYPGTRGGEAVASVLLGEVSPAGRLPFSWPRHVGHVPIVSAHYRTFEPHEQDTRYFEEESTPLYPFGHGLSYAAFEYSNLRLEHDVIAVGSSTVVSVDVRNTWHRQADEVVQLYIHQRHGTSSRPVRELKGFQRVTLEPGESRNVSFELGAEQLGYWSAVTRGVVQDATTIDIWVGDAQAELAAVLRVIA